MSHWNCILKIKAINLYPNSPDLNPIENVWKHAEVFKCKSIWTYQEFERRYFYQLNNWDES